MFARSVHPRTSLCRDPRLFPIRGRFESAGRDSSIDRRWKKLRISSHPWPLWFRHMGQSSMKLQLTFLFCFIGSVAAFAQGTVNFNNSPGAIGGNGAPFYDVDGTTRLEGTAFYGQLWAGPDINSLTPWGEPLTFRTGAGAGFFNTTGKDTSRIIGTVAPGTVATVQVRVWESLAGYYDVAIQGGFKYGQFTRLHGRHRRRRFASIAAGEPDWPHRLQPDSRTGHLRVVRWRRNRTVPAPSRLKRCKPVRSGSITTPCRRPALRGRGVPASQERSPHSRPQTPPAHEEAAAAPGG